MSNENRSLSLFSLVRRLFNIYSPHVMGIKRNKKWRLLAIVTILVNSVLAAYCMNLINTSISVFAEMLSAPVITYALYFNALGVFLAGVVVCSLLNILNVRIGYWLADSLSLSINKKILKALYRDEVHYIIKIQDEVEHADTLDPAQIMSHDNLRLNAKVLDLTTHLLMVTGNFAVGMIGLYAMSVPLTFTLFATVVTIPAYLLVSTVLYGAIYNMLTNKVGGSLQQRLEKESALKSNFHHAVHHVGIRSEAIAFKKGSANELHSLLKTVNDDQMCRHSIANVRSGLSFLNSFNASFSNLFAFMLASPSIIAGQLNMGKLFELTNNFQFVVQFFTWKSDRFDDVSECDVLLNKVETLQNKIKKAKILQEQGKQNLRIEKNANAQNIEIRGLSLIGSDGKLIAKNGVPILQNFSEQIKKGHVVRIKGKSGAGKTSFLRSLAGLNPYARGQIVGMPEPEKVYFVPSEPYFPHGKTLLEALFYPRLMADVTPPEKAFAATLMNDVGLQSKVELLDTVRDWYGKDLSDGERKRIMLVGAILAKPDLLFMDEGTRGLDPSTKQLVETTLKKHLVGTTIIYVDHDPVKTGDPKARFYDRKIVLGAP